METPESNPDMYKSLVKEVKDYILLSYDLLRLNLVEKLSRVIALILSLFVGILLLVTALVYFSLAFVYWTGIFFGSLIPGFLILGGLFLLLFFIFFSLRKRLFVNPMIKFLSGIFFNEPPKADEDEE